MSPRELDALILSLCREKDALAAEVRTAPPGAGRTAAERSRRAAAEARLNELGEDLTAARVALRMST
jgi:hypothetical protein